MTTIRTKEQSISRAERRRMMRDPTREHKMFVVNMNAPEYDRLIAHGQIIIHDMTDIQQCMAGLGSTPKKFRMMRQKELTEQWNGCVEKLEAIQDRMKEIEEANSKENETTNQLTTSASDRGSSSKVPEPRKHNKQ